MGTDGSDNILYGETKPRKAAPVDRSALNRDEIEILSTDTFLKWKLSKIGGQWFAKSEDGFEVGSFADRQGCIQHLVNKEVDVDIERIGDVIIEHPAPEVFYIKRRDEQEDLQGPFRDLEDARQHAWDLAHE